MRAIHLAIVLSAGCAGRVEDEPVPRPVPVDTSSGTPADSNSDSDTPEPPDSASEVEDTAPPGCADTGAPVLAGALGTVAPAGTFNGEANFSIAGYLTYVSPDVTGDGNADVLAYRQKPPSGAFDDSWVVLAGPFVGGGPLGASASAVLNTAIGFETNVNPLVLTDLDADGIDDAVLFGYATSTVLMDVWVLRGPLVSNATYDSVYNAHFSSDYLRGASVGAGGDLTGDGLPDISIAGLWWSPDQAGISVPGAIYVHDGHVAGEWDIQADAVAEIHGMLDDTPDEVVEGESLGGGAGEHSHQDLTGDGVVDLLVAAMANDEPWSESHLLYTWNGPLNGIYDSGTWDFRLEPTLQVLHVGGSALGLQQWTDVADFDGDGYLDLVTPSGATDPAGEDTIAAVIVLGPLAGERTVGDADGHLFSDHQPVEGAAVIHPVGDLDLDGLSEQAVSGISEGNERVWLLETPTAIAGVNWVEDLAIAEFDLQNNAQATWQTAGGYDLTGDCEPDLVVGSYHASSGGFDSNGAVFVYEGGRW